MADRFSCFKDFRKALREVILLLISAKANSEKRYVSNVFLKSSLILLLTKFEAFLENLVSEYVDYLNKNLCLKPDNLILQHSIETISNFTQLTKDKKKKTLKSLASLWHQEQGKISISNKFAYGKHGSSELEDLFKRIDYEDIFEKITIYDTKNIFNDDEQIPINFKYKFDEVVFKRNNILHEDASINFTIEDIKKYISYFYQFSNQVEYLLRKDIEEQIASYSYNDEENPQHLAWIYSFHNIH